jgi:hypothetical protein
MCAVPHPVIGTLGATDSHTTARHAQGGKTHSAQGVSEIEEFQESPEKGMWCGEGSLPMAPLVRESPVPLAGQGQRREGGGNRSAIRI